MTNHKRFAESAIVSFLAGCVLLVLIPASPLLQRLPSWDSGTFLYIGWRMTAGALPYRDAWDSKPPLVFDIDALGLWLGRGSRWGVWTIEVISLLIAALIAFALLKRLVGRWPAIYTSFAWLLNAFLVMDGGNYTTEYALPLQFGCLWLIGTAPGDTPSPRRAFAAGVAGGLLFWLKPNLIGIPAAIALYFALRILVSSSKRMDARVLAWMGVGALLISLVVVSPFILHNSLGALWDSAFRFNFLYIKTTWAKRLSTMSGVPALLPAGGLALLAFMGWCLTAAAAAEAACRRENIDARMQNLVAAARDEHSPGADLPISRKPMVSLILIALIALPLDLMFSSLSGFLFDHYFLQVLPVFSIFAGLAFCTMLGALKRARPHAWAAVWFTVAAIGFTAFFNVNNARSIFERLTYRQNDVMIRYIDQNTRPEDLVLIWGGEVRLYFAAKRAMPVRCVVVNHLLYGFANVTRVQEYLDQVIHHPPRLIFDTGQFPFLQFPVTSVGIEEAKQRIHASYHQIADVNGWKVYERVAD